MLFPNQDSTRVTLPQVMATKDFDLIVQNTLNPRAQVDVTVVNIRNMLAFIRKTFQELTLDIFLPIISVLVGPPHEDYVQTWSPRGIYAIKKEQ